MERELQSHQYGKLRGKQVSPVQPEHGLCPLDQRLQLLALHVVQLGGEDQTCSRAELPVLFVDHLAEDQLLKVDICLRFKVSERVVRKEGPSLILKYQALEFTMAIVTLSMSQPSPILRISSLMLLSLLRDNWTPGNLSINFSLSSFFRSLGFTYSMTLVM